MSAQPEDDDGYELSVLIFVCCCCCCCFFITLHSSSRFQKKRILQQLFHSWKCISVSFEGSFSTPQSFVSHFFSLTGHNSVWGLTRQAFNIIESVSIQKSGIPIISRGKEQLIRRDRWTEIKRNKTQLIDHSDKELFFFLLLLLNQKINKTHIKC